MNDKIQDTFLVGGRQAEPPPPPLSDAQIQAEILEAAAQRFEQAIGKAPITGTRAARMLRDMKPGYTSNESDGN